MATKKLNSFLLTAIACFSMSCTKNRKQPQPNIIVIMADDHATNAISAYGSHLASVAPTPNIDRIANEGVLLNHCFSTNAICTPSRATLLTGQYNHINNVRTLKDHFYPKEDHLAQIMQKNGYQTAIFGKWHLHSEPTGFDQWQVLPSQGHYFDPEFKVKGYDKDTSYEDRKMVKQKGYVTDIITNLSLKWLKNRDTESPFMLMVHQKAPHALWEYHPKYRSLFKGITLPEPPSLFEDKTHRAKETIVKQNDLHRLAQRMSGQIKISSVHNYTEWPTGALDIEGLSEHDMIKATYQKYLKDYLRCVASVDEGVGKILDYLDQNNLTENTIIIYTSDQGMFLGEHEYLDKRWFFEEGIRMPFMIKWPKELSHDQKRNHIISNVDFAPTILDMCGINTPSRMQGKSFLPVLKDENTDWENLLYYRYWMHRDMTPAHFGIRTPNYKLIYYYGMNLDTHSFGHPNSKPAWEFYDLKNDPHEINNQYRNANYRKTIDSLKIVLEMKRQKVKDYDLQYPDLLSNYMKSN
ncbi:sulfatase [Halosquirtibacter xylanolyticus]|uniref:sulfatase family protein n=1 Tax=Halosquirtibacter xylanolyticus TaxID=3374599 RepID=UPI003749A6E8|nr:sulfatase [Prolixibacteraceae bacterium]